MNEPFLRTRIEAQGPATLEDALSSNASSIHEYIKVYLDRYKGKGLGVEQLSVLSALYGILSTKLPEGKDRLEAEKLAFDYSSKVESILCQNPTIAH